MTRILNVWWEDRLVGTLTQDRSGDLGFSYGPDWVTGTDAPALSVSLPKRTEPFLRRECRPFFAGLLPDETQRKQAASALGVSDANDFALLDGMGGDVAGAIRFLPSSIRPAAQSYDPQTKALTERGLIAVIDALPAHPLLAGETGMRLSLAGAQSKLPVVLIDGEVALPAEGQPTTHIIKPPIPQLHAATENEAVVMRLAEAVGLEVARVQPRIVQDRTFLLIERYDRTSATEGRVRRLHQEDFCQALGIPPERKYAAEGGPVFKDCFDLIRRAVIRPGRDVLKLLDAAIFNLIVGNADAHGKNFALLYDRTGPRLAPLYDLLSTVQYANLASNLAMKIGKDATMEDIDERSWHRFATDIGIGVPFIRRRIAELAEAVISESRRVCDNLSSSGLDEKALLHLSKDIVRRAEIVAVKRPKSTPSKRRPQVRSPTS